MKRKLAIVLVAAFMLSAIIPVVANLMSLR